MYLARDISSGMDITRILGNTEENTHAEDLLSPLSFGHTGF